MESEGDTANYRGVRKRKWGKWVSEIRLPNSRQRIWLGSYDSPVKAARAFDAALFCLRGNNANFNFPHQPPNIPGGTDLHPSEIQAVAARYANSLSPSPSPSPTYDDQLLQHIPEPSTSMEINHDVMNTNSIPDYYGIFPGFDDYFMPFTTSSIDYQQEEEEEHVVYDSQADPSFLWSF